MRHRRKITCKLTGDQDFGVKAHIIPRSIYQLDGNPGKLLQIGRDYYKQQGSPIGEYDSQILTQLGEQYFSDCDDFAPRFFLNNGQFNRDRKYDLRDFGIDKNCGLLDIKPHEARLLKLFALSIAWKSSVTTRPFFNRVDLGEAEPQIRELILNQDPGPPEVFPVFLGKHLDTPLAGLPLRHPYVLSADNRRYVRFPLPSITLQIKIDGTPLNVDEVPAVVGGGSQLPIFLLPAYRDSQEGKIVIEELRRQR